MRSVQHAGDDVKYSKPNAKSHDIYMNIYMNVDEE